MTSIASLSSQPDPAEQVTKPHESEADNVENGHADTVDQVVDDKDTKNIRIIQVYMQLFTINIHIT